MTATELTVRNTKINAARRAKDVDPVGGGSTASSTEFGIER